MKSRLRVGAVPSSEALLSTTCLRSRPMGDAISKPTFPIPATSLQAKSEDVAIAKHNFGQIPVLAGVQAKLTIGAPNDQYEQEADRVADQVMSSPGADSIQRMGNEEDEVQMKPLAGSITPLIQRAAEEDELQAKPIQREAEEDELQMKPIQQEAEEDELQMKPIQREAEEDELQMKPIQREAEEDELQMKAAPATKGVSQTHTGFETRLNQSRDSGSALPDTTRSFMESRFGADLSHVRVHTGSDAVQMNREIGAQAFTHGRDIYFNSGKFDASSNTGQHLLAHELTHVVQQTGAAPLSVQRRVDLGLLRSTQAPAIQCFNPNSNSSSGSSSTDTPSTGSAASSVAAALWQSSAVTPVQQAGEAIKSAEAGEAEATTASDLLNTALNTINSLDPTYRDTGKVATARKLAIFNNWLRVDKNRLAPHMGGEVTSLQVIAQLVTDFAQRFRSEGSEIARQGASGNNATERAISRRAIAAMWNSSVVTPEREIGRSLRQRTASRETAATAIQQSNLIQTAMLSVADTLGANGKESTSRLAILGSTRIEAQLSLLEPHTGQTSSLEELSEDLVNASNEMQEFTSELFPPEVIETQGGGI